MVRILLSLFAGGILAGLIQFFVDYKKLPVPGEGGQAESLDAASSPGFWRRLYQFVKDHWQFVAYLVLGIAGALLVPLFNELAPTGLSGLKPVRDGVDPATNDYRWSLLVLVGYGIVFGYSAVRLLRSLGALLVDRVTRTQQQQDAKMASLEKELAVLKAAQVDPGAPLPAVEPDSQETPNTGDDEAAFTEAASAEEAVAEAAGGEFSALAAAAPVCVETPKPWRDWRLADSLTRLRQAVNALAPNRRKHADGAVGDLAHQNRTSDHNPWVRDGNTARGVVTAIDITHDPAGGCDCNRLAQALERGKDPRIKYVIWNRRIMNAQPIGGAAAWTWRPYTGSNPHNKHIHISVKCDKASYDATGAWQITG